MSDASPAPAGRTRWRRFAIALIPGVAAAGVLLGGMQQGAVAASFAVSGSSFKLKNESLEGKGFQQFGTVDRTVEGKNVPVAVSVIGDATIQRLCQSTIIPTPFGKAVLRLTAGADGRPVRATNLAIDADRLDADVTFHDIEIGRDASTLDRVDGPRGEAGAFGLQSRAVKLTEVKNVAWATNAGTFTVPGLKMSVKFNGPECF